MIGKLSKNSYIKKALLKDNSVLYLIIYSHLVSNKKHNILFGTNMCSSRPSCKVLYINNLDYWFIKIKKDKK